MAPAKRPWFRFYVEAVHDPKLRRLKPEVRWLFAACLAAARQSPIAGYLMISERHAMDWDDLADFAGMTRKQVEAGIDALHDAGVIDFDQSVKTWFVPAWAERQYESDDVTIRTRKHRSKERSISVDGTADGTPPETETESETERGGPERVPQAHDLLAPGRPPSLLEEVDEAVLVLANQHGTGNVIDAVRQLLDDRRRFQWPSDARKALEAILGPPETSRPSPHDAAQHAKRLLMERNARRTRGEACPACDDLGVVELEDGTVAECECKTRRSA